MNDWRQLKQAAQENSVGLGGARQAVTVSFNIKKEKNGDRGDAATR